MVADVPARPSVRSGDKRDGGLSIADVVLCHLGKMQIQRGRSYDGAVALLVCWAVAASCVLMFAVAGQLQRVRGTAGHSKVEVAAFAFAGLAVSGSAAVCLLRGRVAGLVLGVALAVFGLVTSTLMGNNPFGVAFNALLLALLVVVAKSSASLRPKPSSGGPASSWMGRPRGG